MESITNRKTPAGRSLPWRLAKAATVAVLFSVGIMQAATAQVELRVGKSSAETFGFAPVHIADQLGLFTKHGLNVSITDFGGGARLQQGIAAGAVDIGLGSGPEIATLIKGTPARAVAMFMGPPAMLVLLTNSDGPITSAEDLKGKKVAVTQLGSLTAFLTQRLSVGLGWSPTDIEMIALGDDKSRLAALRTNQVDAIVINTATALKLEQEGQGKIIARFGEYVSPFHNHVMFASNDITAREPDAVRAFILAFSEAIAWMRENREQTVEMTKAIQGVDTDIGLAVYDEAMSAFSTDLRFDSVAMDTMANSWVENGTFDTKPDTTPFFTEEFLP